jgi:hypothetical protein
MAPARAYLWVRAALLSPAALPLIHLIAVIVCCVHYHRVFWMFESPDLRQFPFSPPPGGGFSLSWVWLVWVLVVAALYPVCRWFANLKQRRSDTWLSYL